MKLLLALLLLPHIKPLSHRYLFGSSPYYRYIQHYPAHFRADVATDVTPRPPKMKSKPSAPPTTLSFSAKGSAALGELANRGQGLAPILAKCETFLLGFPDTGLYTIDTEQFVNTALVSKDIGHLIAVQIACRALMRRMHFLDPHLKALIRVLIRLPKFVSDGALVESLQQIQTLKPKKT